MKLSTPGLTLLASGQKPITPFQRSVLEALCLVPEGKVTTYKYLAMKINCKSQQAVGQALNRNPYAPAVPCHRVVAHSRSLGGFSGARDGPKLEKKRKLLEEEGVHFDSNGNVSWDCVFDFSE
jgi:methylated-DNA-[protein]-cysteine S-methyltransferase